MSDNQGFGAKQSVPLLVREVHFISCDKSLYSKK